MVFHLVHPLLCTSCRGRASQPKFAPSLHIKALSFELADRVAVFPSRGNKGLRRESYCVICFLHHSRGTPLWWLAPPPCPVGSVSLDSQSPYGSLRIQFPCHPQLRWEHYGRWAFRETGAHGSSGRKTKQPGFARWKCTPSAYGISPGGGDSSGAIFCATYETGR